MTSVEAWNFMRRWSLGPEPPRVVGTVPEDAIGRYADFVSTSPSEYTAATDKLAECIEAVRAGVSAVMEIGSDGGVPVRKVYFNVCGQHSDVPYAGVNIVRVYYNDGQVETLKRIYR